MNGKAKLLIVGIVLIALTQLRSAVAQLGSFFGGPKVATIGTKEIQALQTKQRDAEAKAKVAGEELTDPGFVVVDVRTDEESKVSVIPGAITKAEFEKDMKSYKRRLVIPYCTVGVRSGTYAKQIASKGFKTKNYKGSILDWVENGLPLATPDGKKTNRVHTYSDDYKVPADYQQVTF